MRLAAEQSGLPVWMPERADDPAFLEQIKAAAPDLIVVASYGQFLKKALLEIPSKGVINVHPSLLPAYRGASPIQWALANGDAETGVSVLYVTPKMDAGDILAQEQASIEINDTFSTLEPRLARLGGVLLLRVLDAMTQGNASSFPQDESRVTWARKLVKEDGAVEWNQPADAIRNRLRGFDPWPGCHTWLANGALLKILELRTEISPHTDATPGTILSLAGTGPLVAAGAGTACRLLRVQPAGKAPMTGQAYACGRHLQTGDLFRPPPIT
jgi:methionyl-tRNA formyltransferase